MDAQTRFTYLLTEVLESQPSHIVDHSWDGRRGRIVVTPEGEAKVRSLVSAADSTPVIEVSDPRAIPYIKRSEVEVAVLAMAEGAGAAGLAARYEPSTHTVVLTAWTDDQPSVTDALAEATPAFRSERVDAPEVSIEFRAATDAPREAAATQGGWAYGSCTGGFIGVRGSTYGIITAAHCTTKPSTYDGGTTGTTHVASSLRDVRYTVLSGTTPQNKIRIGSGTYKTITAYASPTVGMTIDMYGKVSAGNTTTIESNPGCVTFTSGNTWCDLFYTTDKVTQPGDSGGPWYRGSTAYGLTTGNNAGGSYITPVGYAGLVSGGAAYVKTSP